MEWLIDNADAYESIISAIRRARTSVCISQLAFDVNCEAFAPDGRVTRLLDVLVAAAERHALRVRILLNTSILVNTAPALRAELARRGVIGVEVRGIDRFPQLLHAKMLIVDDRDGFLLGSPFVNGYWDDSTHRPVDARRPTRELGGRPLHDLSVRVGRGAARQLRSVFDEWWAGAADGATPMAPPSAVRPVRTVTQRVLRTAPARVLAAHRDGHVEILAAMLRGISRARELLYIEHQYLSSRKVIGAVADALARHPQLEVVALVNQNPDVTAYRGWQNARLRDSGLLAHDRFGLFALWSQARDGERLLLNQVFVHSKVIVADDRWATVGSANVDGVSLHSYGADFESRLGERVFRRVRNFDVNLELEGAHEARAIETLRRRLWLEHLGDDLPDQRPRRGWLWHWRACAAANVAELNAFPSAATSRASRSFVLPYGTASRPARQLEDAGVRHRASLHVCFDPSWLEVHCSPNWIRNMFE
ncbi:MAG: phospholipase D-like domain-containing protein [bacterium]